MKKLKRGQKAPIEDWLAQLPEGYRERALAQVKPDWFFPKVVDCLEHAVGLFAYWEYTKEGVRFWEKVKKWAHNPDENALPPLPDDGGNDNSWGAVHAPPRYPAQNTLPPLPDDGDAQKTSPETETN